MDLWNSCGLAKVIFPAEGETLAFDCPGPCPDRSLKNETLLPLWTVCAQSPLRRQSVC